MDEIARLLTSHPEFSSWLMSDSYTKDVSRGDLRRAFQTLRFRPEGEEIIRLFQRDPTALRRAASVASGFSSGADAARLTGLRSLLPRLAGVGRGLSGGLGGLAAAFLGGEAMDILAEDKAAKDRIREMDRNRAVARSLDRELRSADRRGDEQRQRLEDARARQARLRREIDSSVYTAERPLPVSMARRPVSVAERDLEGRLRVTMEPSVASISRPRPDAPARRAPVVERMRELMPTTLVERTRRSDMGIPVQDIVMAELRREPEMRRQFVKSDIPGVMGTWQDLPYELQPATTLSEREIRRMIEASR